MHNVFVSMRATHDAVYMQSLRKFDLVGLYRSNTEERDEDTRWRCGHGASKSDSDWEYEVRNYNARSCVILRCDALGLNVY